MFTVSKKTHLHHFVLISCMITLKSAVKSLLFYVRKLHFFLKEVSLHFFDKGAQHNYLVNPDQTLENQLTKERTIQDSPNSWILWKNPALPASLWRAGREIPPEGTDLPLVVPFSQCWATLSCDGHWAAQWISASSWCQEEVHHERTWQKLWSGGGGDEGILQRKALHLFAFSSSLFST